MKQKSTMRVGHETTHIAKRRGILPSPKEQLCVRCGVSRARVYHHPEGYEGENVLNVEALCDQCHRKAHPRSTEALEAMKEKLRAYHAARKAAKEQADRV